MVDCLKCVVHFIMQIECLILKGYKTLSGLDIPS